MRIGWWSRQRSASVTISFLQNSGRFKFGEIRPWSGIWTYEIILMKTKFRIGSWIEHIEEGILTFTSYVFVHSRFIILLTLVLFFYPVQTNKVIRYLWHQNTIVKQSGKWLRWRERQKDGIYFCICLRKFLNKIRNALIESDSTDHEFMTNFYRN